MVLQWSPLLSGWDRLLRLDAGFRCLTHVARCVSTEDGSVRLGLVGCTGAIRVGLWLQWVDGGKHGMEAWTQGRVIDPRWTSTQWGSRKSTVNASGQVVRIPGGTCLVPKVLLCLRAKVHVWGGDWLLFLMS